MQAPTQIHRDTQTADADADADTGTGTDTNTDTDTDTDRHTRQGWWKARTDGRSAMCVCAWRARGR